MLESDLRWNGKCKKTVADLHFVVNERNHLNVYLTGKDFMLGKNLVRENNHTKISNLRLKELSSLYYTSFFIIGFKYNLSIFRFSIKYYGNNSPQNDL